MRPSVANRRVRLLAQWADYDESARRTKRDQAKKWPRAEWMREGGRLGICRRERMREESLLEQGPNFATAQAEICMTTLGYETKDKLIIFILILWDS